MPLTAHCPRCREALRPDPAGGADVCPQHGRTAPLWLPEDVTYEGFGEHLRRADGFPTYLPWPMGPGWSVSEFGVVAPGSTAVATLTCSSGTSALDGPVDVFVVTEEAGTGLGARCAGLAGADPGPETGDGQPVARVRIGSKSVPLWAVSTSRADHEFDRSVCAGEADGRWLWIVVRPAPAILLLRDDWILRDVSNVGPPLLEMSFGGPRPVW